MVVVGSLNLDTVLRVAALPGHGETVSSVERSEQLGGKGLNQAVAAARAGVSVAMVGAVGADRAGQRLLDGLAAEGVDVTHVAVDGTRPTGEAFVIVDADAENAIVVHAGANAAVSPDYIRAADALLADAKVVVAQLEVPLEAVEAAARRTKGTFVLNPAPAAPLPQRLLDRVDVLVPNESEASSLKSRADATGSARSAAEQIAGPRAVVLTLGAEGALVWTGVGSPVRVPAPEVRAIDTVGAGDCCCGYLAAALAEGEGLVDAVARGVAAASLSTTRKGASAAMPTREEVAALHRGRPA